MLTFGDLITGNISDSPADREAAPFLLFLTFPVVAPLSIVYYTGKGTYHLGKAIYNHNPIRFMMDRAASKKKLIKMKENGINPFEEKKNIEVNTDDSDVRRMNTFEKDELVSKVNEQLSENKSFMPFENSNIYPVKKIDSYRPKNGLTEYEADKLFYSDESIGFDEVYEPVEKIEIGHKTDFTKKVKKLTLTNKKGQ